MFKPVNSGSSEVLREVDIRLEEATKTSDASALIEKVRTLVKKYDFAPARATADQIPNETERALAHELIEITVNNFSTIERDFPWDYLQTKPVW